MSSGRTNNADEPIVNKTNIQKEIRLYRNAKTNKNWSDFEEYVDYQTRLWQISFKEDKNEWQTSSTCNCISFQKNYVCKHILLQAIRYNFIEVPLTAHTVELEDKAKRVRPKTISKALQIDPPASVIKPKIKKVSDDKQTKKRKKESDDEQAKKKRKRCVKKK